MSTNGTASTKRTAALHVVIGVLALVSGIATLVYVLYGFVKSPQNPVAAEIGFEALRVARKLPLYVDPWKGAWEDGAPPSRYYVLYTPVFPWLVGKLAAIFTSPTLDGVKLAGRTVAFFGWLVVQALPVVHAPKDRRRETAIAAMLGGGIFFISRHAASMSPDTLATAFVIAGVVRAVKKDKIDPIAMMLLVTAPLIKPSCLGGIAGAGLVHLALRRRGWVQSILAGLVMAALLVLFAHVTSEGAWLANISRSTGQPLTLTRFVQEYGSRVMVLGIPHMFIAWLAYKRKVTWFVVGPLVGSIAWTTFIQAKHGSGSHYWLETTGLAVIAISQMPATRGEREPAWVAPFVPWGALVVAVLIAILSWPPYLEEPGHWRRHDEIASAVDKHCVRDRAKGDFVVSSDLELELELNGRFSVPAWQSAFLARSGRFPKDAWREDIARPEVKWLALAIDPRQPPGPSNDEQIELNPFYDVLKDVVFTNFDFDREVEGMFVFRRKSLAPSPQAPPP